MWIFIIVLGLVFYFLPTILAFHRKKRNGTAIFALNFFLGFTGIGWIISLVWALTHDGLVVIHEKAKVVDGGNDISVDYKSGTSSRDLIERQGEEKKANLIKILNEFENAGEQKKMTNKDVEKLLGVSDATATRYMEELEKERKIRQVGAEGGHVYYEKI